MQKSFKEEKSTLFIVSTPIGNLKDITYRAVEILNTVDFILAEDTRTSGVLLSHYNIKKPLISYHEFNKEEQKNRILGLLAEGKNLALISDAGTPGISDPGYEIIRDCIKEDYHVVSIPGASAILPALVTSGLIIQPFTFIGFLPRKSSFAKKLIDSYQKRVETLVIYESPNRISKTIELLYACLGNRRISIARELTKAFETIIRTTLEEAIEIEHNPKGEYVIIVEGNHEKESFEDESIESHYKRYIDDGLTEKDAIKAVAKDRELPKNDVYQIIKNKK
jgi:16S rRNA (cytidine1402-2'-O)-methyltransferase